MKEKPKKLQFLNFIVFWIYEKKIKIKKMKKKTQQTLSPLFIQIIFYYLTNNLTICLPHNFC